MFIALSVGAFLVGAVVLPGLIASGWMFAAGWAASGIWLYAFARKRYTEASLAYAANMHALRAQSMMIAGECAMPWVDGEPHLCVRPYGHTGPHVCGICPDVTR